MRGARSLSSTGNVKILGKIMHWRKCAVSGKRGAQAARPGGRSLPMRAVAVAAQSIIWGLRGTAAEGRRPGDPSPLHLAVLPVCGPAARARPFPRGPHRARPARTARDEDSGPTMSRSYCPQCPPSGGQTLARPLRGPQQAPVSWPVSRLPNKSLLGR